MVYITHIPLSRYLSGSYMSLESVGERWIKHSCGCHSDLSPHLQTFINHNYISLFAEAALISSSCLCWSQWLFELRFDQRIILPWNCLPCLKLERKYDCKLTDTGSGVTSSVWQIKMAGLDGRPTWLCLYAQIFLCLQIWSLISTYCLLLIRAVQRLIAINRIQNKSLCLYTLIYVCVCCV